ncbi:MAG: glycine--tRNA ligase subunit beta, partial [Eggerthellaceae bacterium]|nr:glycine--tRNA ligase subunit beta [Eggerthellaceae bacterium]
RAAYLAKADLVTNAVIEFTSVQGIMGSYYALASGEDERVAQAIADQYKPRFSGDEPPADIAGQIIALADKIDTICGMFAIGQAPTGSSDPFALRRAALGAITILLTGLPVTLKNAVESSLAIYASDGLEFDNVEVMQQVFDFFVTRIKVMTREAGYALDAIEAVLSIGVYEPVEFKNRVEALEKARNEHPETFDDLATAFARANNLRDRNAGTSFDKSLLTPVESELAEAIYTAETQVNKTLRDDDFDGAINALAALRSPIDAFFDEVLVMDEDESLRNNRMKILNRLTTMFSRVADFEKMAKVRQD